jgi:hypothetical protein
MVNEKGSDFQAQADQRGSPAKRRCQQLGMPSYRPCMANNAAGTKLGAASSQGSPIVGKGLTIGRSRGGLPSHGGYAFARQRPLKTVARYPDQKSWRRDAFRGEYL